MTAMKGRSGNPKGRTPGTKNRRTQLAEAAVAAIIKDKKTPLDFLLGVMLSPKMPMGLRLDAAKSAAPYIHKKQPVNLEVGGSLTHNHRGGVMVVPAVENAEQWSLRSAQSQAKLKEEVRH